MAVVNVSSLYAVEKEYESVLASKLMFVPPLAMATEEMPPVS